MPTLAILELDPIGNYIVFRNFIKEIKNSQKYAGYKIILIGNIIYKDFAKNLDDQFIDKFIGVNVNHYKKYGFYRQFITNTINSYKIDTLISPTYSRDMQCVENIVQSSVVATEKIGSSGDCTYITLGQKKEADKNYTQLIQQAEKPIFEFDRYKEFFEKLLNKKFDIKTPIIETDDIENARLVAFFPGAGSKTRRWSVTNFAKLADFIYQNYDYKICILGDKKDKKIAKEIIKNSSAVCYDMTGKLPLEKLPSYCKKMQFVITNDTAGLHIAAAVGTKTICISNGSFYPRYVEYPNNDVVKVIYSDEVKNNLNKPKYVKENLLYGSNFDINDVTVEKVINAVKEILSKQENKKAVTKAKTVTKKVVKKTNATKKTATSKTDTKKATPKTTKKVTSKTTTKKVATKKATTKKVTTRKTTKKEEK